MIYTPVVSGNETESTGVVTKMKLSDIASTMVFQMFTKNVYSDPIGTVVREITSNCFDAHAELEKNTKKPVNKPVIVKLEKDNVTDSYNILFIDHGVGMSPYRIENIYGVYFESTKRESNTEIGGFGIGGKTPLAYGDSFFVTTKYDGIKYYYNIVKGKDSPEIHLLLQEETQEENGTEVKVPIKTNDLSKFFNAVRKQLHYFENVYFEGFENPYYGEITNDYVIFRGENFLYRIDSESKYSNSVHLCVGKVAYPLDFDQLELSEYEYRIPIALKFDIGELRPTASRESIDYSINEEENYNPIKLIKEKLEAALNELRAMYYKQCEDVVSIFDYYHASSKEKKIFFKKPNGEFVELNVGAIIEKNKIEYANFKYNKFIIPEWSTLIKHFYKQKLFGKYDRGGKEETIIKKISLTYFNASGSVYHVNSQYKRNNRKQNYLKDKYKNFVVLEPEENLFYKSILSDLGFSVENVVYDDDNGSTISTKVFYKNKTSLFSDTIEFNYEDLCKQVDELKKDVDAFVKQKTDNYNNIVVPEDFFTKRDLLDEISKGDKLINVNAPNMGSRRNVSLLELYKFKGKIVYSTIDEKDKIYGAYRMFRDKYDSDYLCSVNYNGKISCSKKVKESGCFLLIYISNGNKKLLEKLPNVMHVEKFGAKYLLRIINKNIHNVALNKAMKDYVSGIDPFYYESNIIDHISPEIAKLNAPIKQYLESNEYYDVNVLDHLNMHSNRAVANYYDKHIKKEIENLGERLVRVYKKDMEKLIELSNKNKGILKWFNIKRYNEYITIDPDGSEDDRKLIEMLQLVHQE